MRRTTTILLAMLALTTAMTTPQSAHASLWGALTELTDGSYASYQEIGFANLTNRNVLVEVWDEAGYYTNRNVPAGMQFSLMTSNPNSNQVFAVRISVSNNGRWIAKDYEFWGSDARVFIQKAGRGDFYMSGYYLR